MSQTALRKRGNTYPSASSLAQPANDPAPEASDSAPRRISLADRLRESRALSLQLAAPLSDEDQTVQVMDDASPTKWHLAHTTWFYEAFVLRPHLTGYGPFSDAFDYCFNSYYETAGERHPRARRGHLTRPAAAEVRAYRAHINAGLDKLLASEASRSPEVAGLIELGINHEQQHQELLLMDILALFAANPLHPAYRTHTDSNRARKPAGNGQANWVSHDGGIVEIGAQGDGFHYDNEGPRHTALVQPFKLADRCVTNREWIEFIADGGYRDPLLWLADGWATVKREGWEAPGYWENVDGEWKQMTLDGLTPVEPRAPVCHVSYYEADAFARWCGKRLATEFEWEAAASAGRLCGTMNTLGSGALRPLPAGGEAIGDGLRQMQGDVWEWTASAYLPYPGYRPPAGAVGEYNGKFMVSQHVLRGASFATPDGHSRTTYRNFFYPHQRWQFAGLRLAEDNQ
ncbi:MAG: ergothioneine biosynthesis protein EgtB [Hyphomicrobiaceae bacterium]